MKLKNNNKGSAVQNVSGNRLFETLKRLRGKSKPVLDFDDITNEIEIARGKRYVK